MAFRHSILFPTACSRRYFIIPRIAVLSHSYGRTVTAIQNGAYGAESEKTIEKVKPLQTFTASGKLIGATVGGQTIRYILDEGNVRTVLTSADGSCIILSIPSGTKAYPNRIYRKAGRIINSILVNSTGNDFIYTRNSDKEPETPEITPSTPIPETSEPTPETTPQPTSIPTPPTGTESHIDGDNHTTNNVITETAGEPFVVVREITPEAIIVPGIKYTVEIPQEMVPKGYVSVHKIDEDDEEYWILEENETPLSGFNVVDVDKANPTTGDPSRIENLLIPLLALLYKCFRFRYKAFK